MQFYNCPGPFMRCYRGASSVLRYCAFGREKSLKRLNGCGFGTCPLPSEFPLLNLDRVSFTYAKLVCNLRNLLDLWFLSENQMAAMAKRSSYNYSLYSFLDQKTFHGQSHLSHLLIELLQHALHGLSLKSMLSNEMSTGKSAQSHWIRDGWQINLIMFNK